MRMLYLALILGAGLALLSACGAATPKAIEMNISMTEFSYTPNVIEAKVGQQVTLHLMNTGALQHEIMFGRNMMMENGHPNGYEMDMFSMAGMEPSVTFSGGMEGMSGGMDMGQSGMQHGGYSVILPTRSGDGRHHLYRDAGHGGRVGIRLLRAGWSPLHSRHDRQACRDPVNINHKGLWLCEVLLDKKPPKDRAAFSFIILLSIHQYPRAATQERPLASPPRCGWRLEAC